ncbi:UNVERIFIED_CONTAM: hypothetical protein H355_009455 [Colinus virginianus]|nr:hypothetical protein H355_009455 [Colinus virginianus]
MAEPADYPPFQLGKPRFEQTSFYGRFRHFLDIIDPRTLFVTESRLKEAVQLLEDYKHGTLPPGVTNKELWGAQKIKQAIIHPDTNETIFMPFRMSGFTVFGFSFELTTFRVSCVLGLLSFGFAVFEFFFELTACCVHGLLSLLSFGHIVFGLTVFGFSFELTNFWVVGLLLPNQTIASTVFWQWLNQSHNACVNYANRNATKPSPTSKFIQGYLGAVISAVSIAVASANICNVVLMRHTELEEGIDVLDNNGNIVGSSRIAAKHALLETALTRVVLPMPILVLPPIIMSILENCVLLSGFVLASSSPSKATPKGKVLYPSSAEDLCTSSGREHPEISVIE